MKLQNQNNQNLNSSINQFAEQIRKSGKNPKQMVMDLLTSGKISQKDFENAKRFAESQMRTK